ncbi:MAG: hypothetical protein KatS3mg114_0183 [Planctomycetaceae bacterium]|nr:MAG: hypothetical protein KatS3mg114_0183 [Planctomycetaceae bacterium]
MTGLSTVGAALEWLTRGLTPHVQQQLQRVWGDDWLRVIRRSARDESEHLATGRDPDTWDAQLVLAIMWEHWNEAFRQHLGLAERSLVAELRDFRNRWAHQYDWNWYDTYRMVDSCLRLLTAVQAPADCVQALAQMREDLLQTRWLEHQPSLPDTRELQELKTEVGLLGLAGLAIIVATLVTFGSRNLTGALIIVGFTFIVFTYSIWKRWQCTKSKRLQAHWPMRPGGGEPSPQTALSPTHKAADSLEHPTTAVPA